MASLSSFQHGEAAYFWDSELLIANGADMNTQEKHGDTPLDEADGETADLLRKHGAKTAKELKAAGN